MTDVVTTKGETFSHIESCRMAYLIWKRFGKNKRSAAAAWRRMLENNCSDEQFMGLVCEVCYHPEQHFKG